MIDENKTIDTLYSDYNSLLTFLKEKREISFLSEVSVLLSKVLIISIASFFEREIKDLLINFTEKQSNNSEPLIKFVKNKAIERRYHEYFNWDSSNANSFFGLFGENFKNYINRELNDEIKDAIKAFLELGGLRNLLVHNDFANFPLDKTLDEVYELYKKAKKFIPFFNEKLHNYTMIQDREKKI